VLTLTGCRFGGSAGETCKSFSRTALERIGRGRPPACPALNGVAPARGDTALELHSQTRRAARAGVSVNGVALERIGPRVPACRDAKCRAALPTRRLDRPREAPRVPGAERRRPGARRHGARAALPNPARGSSGRPPVSVNGVALELELAERRRARANRAASPRVPRRQMSRHPARGDTNLANRVKSIC